MRQSATGKWSTTGQVSRVTGGSGRRRGQRVGDPLAADAVGHPAVVLRSMMLPHWGDLALRLRRTLSTRHEQTFPRRRLV